MAHTSDVSTSISCVIPAYNRAEVIGRAIQSALDQVYSPAEVIVVDDGSTDATAEVVQSFGHPVRLITQENRGGAAARHSGAQAASSHWVAFLDSDDYWTPHHLSCLREAVIATAGEARYYFANLRREDQDDSQSQWQLTEFEAADPWELVADGAQWLFRPRIPMMLQGALFHREAFLERGGLWADLRRRHDTHCFFVHGYRQPICALNHIGTIMTSESGGGRLTAEMAPNSEPYLEYTALLWGDLLRQLPELSSSEASLLRTRLVQSQLRLARAAFREGAWLDGILRLARPAIKNPVVAYRLTLKRAR